MFTKHKKVADVYQKRGEVYRPEINWVAVIFWGFIGLAVLGAIFD